MDFLFFGKIFGKQYLIQRYSLCAWESYGKKLEGVCGYWCWRVLICVFVTKACKGDIHWLKLFLNFSKPPLPLNSWHNKENLTNVWNVKNPKKFEKVNISCTPAISLIQKIFFVKKIYSIKFSPTSSKSNVSNAIRK